MEVIKDIPKGKTLWMVDQSDMVKVKKTLGKNACLFGNVPSSMLNLGTPQSVKAYVKKLIDTAGKDGGLIIGNGAFFDEAKSENVKAMIDAAKEYGAYK
jgi:uroporphyrinogen-III decarboxylase